MRKPDDAFVNRSFTYRRDASGHKKGGFPLHEASHFHRHCTGILARSHLDIAEIMSPEHEKMKAVNLAYLRQVLQDVVFYLGKG